MENLEKLEKLLQEICNEKKDCAACVLCDVDKGKCFYGFIVGKMVDCKMKLNT